jgi:hypothetical protein
VELNMPTVLDALRRLLLGDEAADSLQLALDILVARTSARLWSSDHHTGKTTKANPQANRESLTFEAAKPSLGYELLLTRMGWDPPAARAIAKFAVDEGQRQARESKASRHAIEDVKFLAK